MLKYFVFGFIALSMVATFVLARSPYFERGQKLLQATVVWLLPVFGALLILVFHSVVYRNMTTRLEPQRSSNNNEDIVAEIIDID